VDTVRPTIVRSRLDVLLVLFAALLLGACGSQAGSPVDAGEGTRAPKDAGEETSMAEQPTELRVSVRTEGRPTVRMYTLRCDPAGGDHPDPGGACAALDRAARAFAPVPKGQLCTQVYGGPQTATIEGTWRGKLVSATFDRTDGCEIARWDSLAAVFGTATGGAGAT